VLKRSDRKEGTSGPGPRADQRGTQKKGIYVALITAKIDSKKE